MAGSISEWTSTPAKPPEYDTTANTVRIIKGGNWHCYARYQFKNTNLMDLAQTECSQVVGFRVAK
jgi:formylglycine-generating enzyme required for sulfatase activity